MKKTFCLKNLRVEKIPSSAGIYFFLGAKNKILYVGKAANLRARIRSYFSAAPSDKIKRLCQEARAIKIVPLRSEIEALIMEARHIKRKRPKYNILMRDDKNYFFVVFTKEPFPRIFITHQPKRIRNSRILGPFVSGRALKVTLRLLRKTFPYCTCAKPHARMCLNEQLRLCPGYCCRISARETGNQRGYGARITAIKKILSGKSAALARELKQKLRRLSSKKEFEKAAAVRDELAGIDRIAAHRGLLLPFEKQDAAEPEANALLALKQILNLKTFPYRIECYDASSLAGTGAVGAMTVFANNLPDTSGWRLFKMHGAVKPNDLSQIEEMLLRRLARRDWPMPDLMLVDGGSAQLAAAVRALARHKLKIPVAAIMKGKSARDRLLWNSGARALSFALLPKDVRTTLANIRDKTHYFALSYQRRIRRKSVFT